MNHAPSFVVTSLTILLTLFISVQVSALNSAHDGGKDGESSGVDMQLGASSSGDSTQFTGDKKVTITTPPSPEEGTSSSDSPTVQASDPSMWEEQPHQDCVSGGGHIPDMDCMYNRMSQPGDPQNNGPAGASPARSR